MQTKAIRSYFRVLGTGKYPQPANRAEVGQNQDARKVVSATLSVLKCALYFGPEARK